MQLYVLPNGDAIEPRLINAVHAAMREKIAGITHPPAVVVGTYKCDTRWPVESDEEARAQRDKIIAAINALRAEKSAEKPTEEPEPKGD